MLEAMNDPLKWLEVGAPIIGYNLTMTVATRRFKLTFGVNEEVVARELWPVLHPAIVDTLQMKSFQPVHVLWGLLFLRKYDTEEDSAARVGVKSVITYRKWSKVVVIQIAMMKNQVVSIHSLYL